MDVTKETLEKEFSRFGKILSIKIKQPTAAIDGKSAEQKPT